MNNLSLIGLILFGIVNLSYVKIFSKSTIFGPLPIITLVFSIAPNSLTIFFGDFVSDLSSGKVMAHNSHAIQVIVSILVNFAYFGMLFYITARIITGAKFILSKIIIIMLLIWIYVSIIDIFKGNLHVANLGIVLILGTVAVWPKLSIQNLVMQTFLLVQVIIILSSISGIVFPEKAWISCRIDKCTFENFLFRGIYPYANQAGLLVGMLAPVGIVIIKKRLVLLLYMIETSFFVYITGSRIALTAISLAYIASFVKMYSSKRKLYILSFLMAFVGLFPFESNTALNGRTFLWEIARSKFLESPLGGGSYAWQNSGFNQYFGAASSYSSHNLILEILLTGGIPILIAYLFMIREIYLNLGITESKALFPFMIAFSVCAIGERPFSFFFIDYSIPIFLTFILLNSSEKPNASLGNVTTE